MVAYAEQEMQRFVAQHRLSAATQAELRTLPLEALLSVLGASKGRAAAAVPLAAQARQVSTNADGGEDAVVMARIAQIKASSRVAFLPEADSMATRAVKLEKPILPTDAPKAKPDVPPGPRSAELGATEVAPKVRERIEARGHKLDIAQGIFDFIHTHALPKEAEQALLMMSTSHVLAIIRSKSLFKGVEASGKANILMAKVKKLDDQVYDLLKRVSKGDLKAKPNRSRSKKRSRSRERHRKSMSRRRRKKPQPQRRSSPRRERRGSPAAARHGRRSQSRAARQRRSRGRRRATAATRASSSSSSSSSPGGRGAKSSNQTTAPVAAARADESAGAEPSKSKGSAARRAATLAALAATAAESAKEQRSQEEPAEMVGAEDSEAPEPASALVPAEAAGNTAGAPDASDVIAPGSSALSIQPEGEGEQRVWDWLFELDSGRGSLLRYFGAIRTEFDADFSQIAAARLPTPITPGTLGSIEPSFFEVLGVKPIGHRLLFAKGIAALP